MNLSKLAQLANVSVSTLSKAFSDSKEISEQTKDIIFSVAKEYGCFNKYYKPKYSKKVIAIICPEILGIHYTNMVTFFSNEISIRDGTMIISASNFSHKREQELVDYYTKFVHADGIIIIEPSGIIKNNTEVPIVQIGIENESKNIDCVNVVADGAINDTLRYLMDKGIDKIGFIGEIYAKQEYNYFKSGLLKQNIPINERYICISNKRFYDAGYYGIDKMIKDNCIPQVVFAAYSHIAVGIMQRLKEERISVPEDISIVCMDDIPSIPYCDSKFSSIKMHLDEVCATALELLYQKIEKKFFTAKRTVTVIREFEKGETIL